MEKTSITMADIATKAGVSRATASYVINGQQTIVRISEATRQRVLEAARTLGYRRNALARAIVTGKNRVLGVLARNPGPEPKARILEGIRAEAGAYGYFIKLLHHPADEDAREVAIRCIEQRLAGVIVMRPPQIDWLGLRAELDHYQVPMVFLDDSLSDTGILNIASDDFQGMQLAVEHLVGLGHRRIALIEGGRAPHPLLRESAFRQTMAACALFVPEDYLVYGDWDLAQTEQGIVTLFRDRQSHPTALVCSAGDAFAAVAIRGLRQIGLSIPQDVSIVGYSNLLLAACVDPALTTIAQPFEEMGRAAVYHLLHRLENPEAAIGDQPTEQLLPTQLIVRTSTGSVPHEVSDKQ